MATDSATVELARELLRIVIIDERSVVADQIATCLTSTSAPSVDATLAVTIAAGRNLKLDRASEFIEQEAIIFSPLRPTQTRFGKARLRVDVAFADSVFRSAREAGIHRFVLMSSAEVYGSDYHNPGMVRENSLVKRRRRNGIADKWSEVEALAINVFRNSPCRLSILRPSYVLHGDQREFASRYFGSRFVCTIAGHDPCVQLLTLRDIASAVSQVVLADTEGVFNIAPRETLTLSKALRHAAIRRWRLPYTLQKMARSVLAPFGITETQDQADFLRYPWTVSDQKLQSELEFMPADSSLAAISKMRGQRTTESTGIDTSPMQDPSSYPVKLATVNARATNARMDDFGMDDRYIHSCSRWQFQFMEKFYWRLETQGLENIPRSGGAVLAGIHRGFMPFDGVMLVHLLSKYAGRIPRFLIHPGLVKYPYLSTFLIRIGGVIACQENADAVLNGREILGVFPEGIRGAFRMYNRDVYKIGKHRDNYIKTALRHRVPIIPFVTLGPAETFPIFGKFESSWWKQRTHWPFIPLTPTANLIPLPVKWHFKILAPISTEHFPADAANNRSVVRALDQQVQQQMQSAIDEMLTRRRSVFWGTVFRPQAEAMHQPAILPCMEEQTAPAMMCVRETA